jgi:hypothetical protein
VVEFLALLSAQGRELRPLLSLVSELRDPQVPRPPSAVVHLAIERLSDAASGGALVWGHRTHGDFAPWNCSWTTAGLFVFDWERSQEWDLALSDAFHHVVGPFIQIHRNRDPRRVSREALQFARAVALRAGLAIDDLTPYWTAWLLRRDRESPGSGYARLLQMR